MFSIFQNLFGPKADFKHLTENGAVIIDVRTQQEFRSGHIENSINIPLSDIESSLKKIQGYGKPIIACCRSGARSGSAVSILKSEGVEAYNGGAWNSLERAINA